MSNWALWDMIKLAHYLSAVTTHSIDIQISSKSILNWILKKNRSAYNIKKQTETFTHVHKHSLSVSRNRLKYITPHDNKKKKDKKRRKETHQNVCTARWLLVISESDLNACNQWNPKYVNKFPHYLQYSISWNKSNINITMQVNHFSNTWDTGW